MNSITFRSVAERWIGEKQHYVKQSTYCAYLLVLKTHLLPAFGSRFGITEADAQSLVLDKLASGLSRKTVRDILAVLRAVLKYGAKHCGYELPVWDIKFPASSEHKALPVLSVANHRKLMRYLMDMPTSRNIGVLLSVCTGMRIGEVCALRWADVDFVRRVISVCRTTGRIYNAAESRTERTLTAPKTYASVREIPMCRELYDALRYIRKDMRAAVYVVGGGGMPAEPRSYRDYFSRLLDRLSIPRIVFHGLRHTFATRCIECKCDYKTVSAILGHSNISTTLNLYVHPDMDQKKRCLDRMVKSVV